MEYFYEACKSKNRARNVREALRTDKDSLAPCKSRSCDMRLMWLEHFKKRAEVPPNFWRLPCACPCTHSIYLPTAKAILEATAATCHSKYIYIKKKKKGISSKNNWRATGGGIWHEWGEDIREKGTIYFLVLPVWISIKLASLKLKVTRLAPFHLKCWWGSWHNYQGRHLSQEASLLIADRPLKN